MIKLERFETVPPKLSANKFQSGKVVKIIIHQFV